MIPLFKVKMSPAVGESVNKTLLSGFIGQGPKVEEFENLLWKSLKTKTRPITLNSCTSAIDLALELCNVGPDDEVITSPQTCFASNVGAIHRRARLRWADIDPITGLIDPVHVAKLITKKTKAIIAVNWGGKFADYTELKKFGVPVIEDAAHTWDVFLDQPVDRGDYICYSFQAIKFLTTADGGILVCPEHTEAEARILRWYGLDRTKNESFRCTQNITRVGFKYHMNDVNATIGIENLPYAYESVNQSRENSKFYCENINNNLLTIPEYDDRCSYWLFSMHVQAGLKDHFTEYLTRHNIACSPVHFRNDFYDSTLCFQESQLPGVDKFTDTQICIPNGWWVSVQDRQHITETLNAYKTV